ncbi:MAG: hypothetical protein KKG04_00700 [Candidatus Thermoplasmatota archaeon]|nr:hypothetical protein [Candidatus Thermoplasmatota archaeon]
MHIIPKKIIHQITVFILLLQILNVFFIIIPSAAPLPELTIYLFEANTPSWEPLDEPIFIEGTTYDVAITEQDNVTFAYNVTITIGTSDETYCTSQSLPYITITAPTYTPQQKELCITATKEGFTTSITPVTILKGALTLTTDRVIVQEDESFSVTVTDHHHTPISDCLIYLDCVSTETATAMTNQKGIAYVPAPSVTYDSEQNIIAVKEGYAAGTTYIRVENLPNTYLGEISTEFSDIIPVILAILSVIGAILYVMVRNRQYNHTPHVKIHHPLEPAPQKQYVPPQNRNHTIQTPNHPPTIQTRDSNDMKSYEKTPMPSPLKYSQHTPSPPRRSPHVEEIRIHVQKQEKKEPDHLTPQQKINHIIPRHKTTHYEWFQGTEDIRYKIDSLTGKIDQQKADKWFEGIDEIRCKVDEKLKNKHKNQEKNT